MPTESQRSATPILLAAVQFLRRFWLRLTVISAVVLLPCFWHSTIQAGDLASHVYNAWLAQWIERGQLPGLWLVRQSNNVLFDLALLHLGDLLGLRAAERIAVSVAVLIFFWGAFAVVCALSHRLAWRALPWLAMLTYGWTFAQGFFNYYISLGLAFWSLAIILRGRGKERLLGLALVPLIWTSHLLGIALVAAVGMYIVVAQKLRALSRALLFPSAVALLFAVRFYLARHLRVLFTPDSLGAYLVRSSGVDQLMLYGTRYRVEAYLLLLFIAAALGTEAFRSDQHAGKRSYRLPVELFALALSAGYLLPWVIFLPQYGGPLGMLTERLSLVTAVFACAVFSVTPVRRWHAPALSAIAIVFFIFLYQDTGKLDRLERQAGDLARNLPRGARVIGVLQPPPGSRILIHHLVDRACIGSCFSFGNYEASSRSFRVRAAPGNSYVTSDWEESEAIRTGSYTVKPQDAPIYEIFQCDASAPLTALCVRSLSPGQGAQPPESAPLSPR